MSRSWIVADREIRALVRTRAFWLSVVLVPFGIFMAGFLPALMQPPNGLAFTIVDQGGRYRPLIEERLELDYQKIVLRDLILYAQRLKLDPPSLAAHLGSTEIFISDAEARAFIEAGGAATVLGEIRPLLPPDAPGFRMPVPMFFEAAQPDGLDAVDGDAFTRALRPRMAGMVATPAGPRTLDLAVFIPAHPDLAGAPILVMYDSRPDLGLAGVVRATLERALRKEAAIRAGLDAAEAARIDRLEAPIVKLAANPGPASRQMALRPVLPVAVASLLLVTVMTAGGMMLQGMIEERSNKLLESLLACVSARELMRGKLVGVGAVGLTIALAWIACAAAGSLFLPHDVAALLRPALAVFAEPWVVVAVVFYFITGYLLTAMIFLAVGAMTDSAQEAQGYLMPMIMLLALPATAVMGGVIQNPAGAVPQIMSWIPLYTPFVMLARLGGGVSTAELLGTGALLLLFVYAELVALGRVFRANLLRTGQPPGLGALVRLMLSSDLG